MTRETDRVEAEIKSLRARVEELESQLMTLLPIVEAVARYHLPPVLRAKCYFCLNPDDNHQSSCPVTQSRAVLPGLHKAVGL